MLEFDNLDKERDLSKNRVVTMDNGSKAFIRSKDPFGFWTIHFEKGPVPAVLSGQYTAYTYAEAALKNYLELQDKRKIETIEKGYGVVTDGNGKLKKV